MFWPLRIFCKRHAVVPIIIVAVIIFVGIICFTVYKYSRRNQAQVRLRQIKSVIIFFSVFFQYVVAPAAQMPDVELGAPVVNVVAELPRVCLPCVHVIL